MFERSQTDVVSESPRASDLVDGPSALSLDDVYHLLQTKRRRDVLRYLHEEGGRVRLRDLAEQVAAWEQETAIENLSSDERQRVYISLYQSHLPKLDNHGIVNYDKDRGWVEPTSLVARLQPYLEPSHRTRSSERWPRRYAATITLCGLFLGATATGIVPVPGLVGAGLVLVAFTVVTGIHAWSTGALHR